jgi:O-antigen/teichoic acid export membrane protein
MGYVAHQEGSQPPEAPPNRRLPQRREVLSGLSWALSGSGVASILQLGVTAVLARLLTPSDFGTVAAATSVIGLAQLFSQVGVGPTIVQRNNIAPDAIRTAHGFAIASGILFAAGMAAMTPLIAAFFGNERLVQIVPILAINFVLRGIGVVPQALLQRDLGFRVLVMLEVSAFIAGSVLCAIPLALAGLGMWALVVGSVVTSGVLSAAVMLLRPVAPRLRTSKSALAKIVRDGGGFTSSYVLNYVALQGDYFVVARTLGAEALGIYTRAYQLMAAPANAVGQPLARVLFSGFARMQSEPARLRSAYLRGLGVLSIVMFPVSAAVIILAPEIVRVVLGPGWDEVVVSFRILAVGSYLRVTHKLAGALAQAAGRSYSVARRQAVYAFLIVSGCAVFSRWGLFGIAWAVQLAMLLHFVSASQLVRSIVGVPWKTFVLVQSHGLAFAATSALVIYFTAAATRAELRPPFETILVSLATGAVLMTLLAKILPAVFMGEPGGWLLAQCREAVKNRVIFVKRRNEPSSVRQAKTDDSDATTGRE